MAKLYVLFQVLCFIVNDNLKPTALHTYHVQTIHSLTRLNKLIEISSSFGFYHGYKTMKNLDFTIVKEYISRVGANEVPAAPVFTPDYPISAAMDNFYHTERNLSGKDSSHNTSLVLFQNVYRDTPLSSNVYSISFRWREFLPRQQLLHIRDYHH